MFCIESIPNVPCDTTKFVKMTVAKFVKMTLANVVKRPLANFVNDLGQFCQNWLTNDVSPAARAGGHIFCPIFFLAISHQREGEEA